ncbi:MAG: hypothetical protein ACR2O3_12125 [Rhizobiaceae bacterium]
MLRHSVIFIFIAFSILLVPQGSVAQETVTLNPSKIGIRSTSTNYREGPCIGLPLSGITADRIFRDFQRTTRAFGNFPVGMVNMVRKGAEPFPCDRWEHDAVQLGVRFNLNSIPIGSTILSARLSWERVPFTLGSILASSQLRPFRSCIGEGFVIGEARTSWPAGFTSRRVRVGCGTRNPFQGCLSSYRSRTAGMLPSRFRLNTFRTAISPVVGEPRRISINVPNAARRWVNIPNRNHGFILSPTSPPAMQKVVFPMTRPDGTRHRNCVGIVRDPRLTVTFRRR